MPPSRIGLGRDAGPIVVAKPRDRFRFDWASTDDTSRVDAANNQPVHGALLLYGRGFLADIDRREQKKVAAAALQKDYGAGAAATYDALDMRVDRHWTDKRADEMTERDRRILRKDFGISYRGSRVPGPCRVGRRAGSAPSCSGTSTGPDTESPRRSRWPPCRSASSGATSSASPKPAPARPPPSCSPCWPTSPACRPPTSHSEADEGPYALVLAPTRELAQQIERETVKLVACLGITVVSIVGGKADSQ
ncbi:atp-dependent rna helicase ddx23 [Hordeum vulgare]|nr:atp-dependent rna helicase ddx23 [Hordeum vulgare]